MKGVQYADSKKRGGEEADKTGRGFVQKMADLDLRAE